MAKLYQRGGVWYCDFYDHGRRIRRSISRDRKTADLRLAEILLQSGPMAKRKNTWFEVYRHFCLNYSAIRHSPATAASCKVSWAHVSELFADVPVADTKPEMVELYQVNRRKLCASVRTVNAEVAFLRQLGAYAAKLNLAEPNPLSKIISLPQGSQRVRWLCLEELRKILETAPNWLNPIIKFAIATGMRRDEIRRLRWREINWQQGIAVLERTKNGQRRAVPLNETALAALRASPRHLGSEFVFVNPQTGAPWSASTLTHSFRRAALAAGIPDCHFHDLRHTAASWLVQAGVEINTVREILGHKDLRMTLRYAHLSQGVGLNAVRQIDNVFEGLRAIKFC